MILLNCLFASNTMDQTSYNLKSFYSKYSGCALQDFVDTLQRDMGRNSESRAGTPSTDEDKCATVAMETSDQQNTSTLTPLVITPKTEDASDTNDSTTWKVTSDNDQQADKEKTDQNCSAIKVEVKEHNPPTLDINVQIKASKSEVRGFGCITFL